MDPINKMDISIERTLIYFSTGLLFYLWFRWRRANLKIFEDNGIPGPPPSFLFGNILELNRKGPLRCQEEWVKKYGKILGYYHGMKPILLVAEVDLLKKIFIKDFNLFSGRPEGIPLRVHSFLDPIIPATKLMDSLLININGPRWKELRRILSPTFSANKLKLMIPVVNKITDAALTVIEEESADGKTINILKILQRLTLDIICGQAFAMEIDCVKNPDHPLLRSANVIFDLPYTSKVIFLGKCFPELGFFAMAISFLSMFIRNRGDIPPLKITKALEVLVTQRRTNPEMRKPDLLQLLIDASVCSTDEKGNSRSSSTNLTLTDLEIYSSALIVFLAGFESTSSALGYTTYFLAKFPKLQQQIQEEIDKVVNKEGTLDYGNINSLQMLERFLLESMRFYPPAINTIWRVASTNVDYGYVRIPKGMEIGVPVTHIHQSDEYWEKPQEFNPDRFLSNANNDLHSVRYWTFGIGPRSCIGSRLVFITAKIILAKILHRFTVHFEDPNQEVKSKFHILTMVPADVRVKLKLRCPQAIS